MSVTLQQIAGYLDGKGIRYRLEEDERQILTAVSAERLHDFLIVIQLDEQGEFFRLFAPSVLTGVQEHRYKTEILETILCISWETKMLQWEYDPSDGEVRAIIEFPVEDSVVTERQFFRCLSALVELVDDFAMPRLLEVMRSGQDPGDTAELGERLLLTIQEEAPGLLNALERAIDARKRRGQTPSPEED
jgi:hypothetical protein